MMGATKPNHRARRSDVLPGTSVPVDRDRADATTGALQTPGHRTGAVESGHGAGPVLCPERLQRGRGGGPGTQAPDDAPAAAGVLLRGGGQTGPQTAGVGGDYLLCAPAALGAELVGGAPTRAGPGCQPLVGAL